MNNVMKRGFLLLEIIISVVLFFSVVSVIYYSLKNLKQEILLNNNYDTFIKKTSVFNYISEDKNINIYDYLIRKGYKINNKVLIKTLKKENYHIKNMGVKNSLIYFLKFKIYKIYNKEYTVKYRNLNINIEGEN